MTIERAIRLLAGCMVLLSLTLAWLVHPWFLGLTAFVGLNLVQSSFTGFCPPEWLFRKMGLREGAAACTRS
ncbi:MAG: DUF2892 domain-containing protein [Planctomycetes bacterium]|nr:DUF2892 domain-containing protein [Planctomycetota bacterium]